jgi:phenylacetate-CoA ligase
VLIWEPQFEKMSRHELEKLQLERLRQQTQYVYDQVPLYRTRFQEAGVVPADVKSLADLSKLPFTSKNDLRDNYPYGLMAVPLSAVVRVHASSGTTGKPIVAPYTARDIDHWSTLMARSLTSAGVHHGDIIQNAYGYGLFTGGLGFHYGGERVGATVIPASVGNTKRQIMLISDLGATVIACTPSYALVLAEAGQEMGISLTSTQLRIATCGAEPWTEKMRAEIEAKVGVSAIDFYGLTEIIGPGVACECQCKCGMHIWEDHFLAEIVDPTTGNPLPYGQLGELVTLYPETCDCGRTLVRMSKVQGRTDDMLIIRGVNVFPSQIEGILLSIEGVEPHYQIIVDRERHLDAIEIWVEVSESVFSDEVRGLENLENKVRAEMDSVLGISAKIKLVEPRTIARTEGKAKRVIDRREL